MFHHPAGDGRVAASTGHGHSGMLSHSATCSANTGEHSACNSPDLFIDGLNVGSYLRDTLLVDKVQSQDEGILEIYRRLRPGDPPTLDTARNLFNNLFFNPDRYDLSKVGRLKMNHKGRQIQLKKFPTVQLEHTMHQRLMLHVLC